MEFLPCCRRSFSELGEVLGEVLAWSDDRKEEKAGAFLTGQNNTMEDIASGSVVAVFRCNSGNNANVGIR